MGQVVHYWDRDLLRNVAVKQVQSAARQTDPRLAHFLWEARVTAYLDHPSVIPSVVGLPPLAPPRRGPASVTPLDIATSQTARFVGSYLDPGTTLLEIGCGEGDLAAHLIARGLHVTAIDNDAARVNAARQKGIDAHVARWPRFDPPPVQAVLFTRSLHHIHPLEPAVARAAEILPEGGHLLVEDFAYDTGTPATIQWFVERLQANRDRFRDVPREFALTLLAADDPVAAWHHDHLHRLHSFEQMRDRAAAHFRDLKTAIVPYLYRYLVPVLRDDPEAGEWLAGFLAEEMAAGAAGDIDPTGRRMVAVR